MPIRVSNVLYDENTEPLAEGNSYSVVEMKLKPVCPAQQLGAQ